MKTKGLVGIVVFSVFCLISINCFASGVHGHKAPEKIGILIVAFGSSEESAQVSCENIDKKIKTASLVAVVGVNMQIEKTSSYRSINSVIA